MRDNCAAGDRGRSIRAVRRLPARLGECNHGWFQQTPSTGTFSSKLPAPSIDSPARRGYDQPRPLKRRGGLRVISLRRRLGT